MEFNDVNPSVVVERRPRRPAEEEDVDGFAPEYRVRARFYAIRQVDGEPAYDWYRRVRAAAVPCKFRGFDRQAAVMADKFVTGLRPGPVADRLLGERADRPLEDLLAVAVAAEEFARRRGAGSDCTTVAPAGAADKIVAGRLSTGATGDGGRDALIDEIREGLKLYRYSSEGYGRRRVGSGCGDAVKHTLPSSQTDNGYNYKSPLGPRENILNGNMKSTFDEKSRRKNVFEKKSKQLKNNITVKNSKEYDVNSYYENRHENYKCYCCSLIYK